jgi:hypothetical protein
VLGERFEHLITDRRREILMRALGVVLIGASVYLAVKLFSRAPNQHAAPAQPDSSLFASRSPPVDCRLRLR